MDTAGRRADPTEVEIGLAVAFIRALRVTLALRVLLAVGIAYSRGSTRKERVVERERGNTVRNGIGLASGR
jgi:hypothetical protein